VPPDEPSLFDLPLAPAEDERAEDDPLDLASRPARPTSPKPRPAGAGELPLFPAEDAERLAADAADEAGYPGDSPGPPASVPATDLPDRERGPARGAAEAAEAADGPDPATAAAAAVPAGWSSRVLASLADGAFLGIALVGGGLGATFLGVWPDTDALAPLALFALVFSFVYSVVPLAFWGRTPGMAAAGLVSRDDDGGPLTFGQTGLRWLGGLLTLAAAGLPLLLALGPLGGRSLADRLSGSQTWAARPR